MESTERTKRRKSVKRFREAQQPHCGHTSCWLNAIDTGTSRAVKCVRVPLTQHFWDCEICEARPYPGKPGHFGSEDCKLGTSLASGGTWRHCTCLKCV